MPEELPESFLETLQDAIQGYLLGRKVIAGKSIKVLTRKESNFEATIQKQIDQITGITVSVLYPFPTRINGEVDGMEAEEISVQIRVIEKVITNRTGVTALYLAEYILRVLHHWRVDPEIEGLNDTAIVAEPNPFEDEPTEPGTNQILISFVTSGYAPTLVGELSAAQTTEP